MTSTFSKVPPPPDFEALEAASFSTVDKRTRVLALIGNLVFSWSNNESLFIYVLMLLLRTDEISAAMVFGTLNTSRARIDLINRLARTNLADKKLKDELSSLIKRFEASNRLRNEFNHSMFTLGDDGSITHTSSMRIEERGGNVRFGTKRPIDAERLKMLSSAIQDAGALNRDIWAFLPRLEAQMTGKKGTPRA